MATSRAVAAVKRAKVVEAVADGATYEQAAQQAGYATRSGAYKAFWKAVDGREADAVEQHRVLELARLDALQVGLWERAEAGDIKAVNAVLRIIEQRSRLLGLDKPEAVPVGTGSVVDPAYWESLKETQCEDTPSAGEERRPLRALG
jgi:hypothetical protein